MSNIDFNKRGNKMKTRFVFALVVSLVLASFLIRCSIDTKHSGEVKQVITLDTAVLNKYFMISCKEQLPGATDDELQTCTDAKVAHLLDFIASQPQ